MSKSIRVTVVIGIVLLVSVGLAAFKMFEPIFVYTSGWDDMPKTESVPMLAELENQDWAEESIRAQDAVARLYPQTNAPALSTAVAIDGELAWRMAMGYADLEALKPISLSHRFRLGSTSKAVTSIAVGVLFDRYDIDLDAPIQTYVPTFPEKQWTVTLRQAMSHTAGVRNYSLCFCFPAWEHLNRRRFASVTDSLRVIADSPLLYEPGTQHSYTSLGYNLAGAAIEHVSGLGFGDFIDEAVFTPLGMTSSGLDIIDREDNMMTRFYEVEEGRYKPATFVDNSIRWPSGGMFSTPGDMVLLGAALVDDRLLSEAVRQRLLEIPEGASYSGEQGYALGWRITELEIGDNLVAKAYHHNGTAVGSTSVFIVLPEYNIIISTMMNRGDTNVEDLYQVSEAILSEFMAR